MGVHLMQDSPGLALVIWLVRTLGEQWKGLGPVRQV